MTRGISIPLFGAAAVLVVLGSVLWIVHIGGEEGGDLPVEAAKKTDSDNDGLSDWEESLWKTDPNNPDTDGDGTSDGDELAENRNPHIPAPNDTLTETKINFSLGTSTVYTPTSLVARNILVQALLNEEGGTDLSSFEELFPQISVPVSSEEDLRVVADTAPARAAYKKELLSVLGTYNQEVQATELENLYYLLSEGDLARQPFFKEMSTAHGARAQKLLALPVPQGAAELHLSFINYFHLLSVSADVLGSSFSDELTLFFGLRGYQNAAEEEERAFRAAQEYFAAHQIAFP